MTVRARIRPATAADFVRFYGREPPEGWFGIAGERRGALVGFGGVTIDADTGRAWAFVDRVGVNLPGKALHRSALLTLAQAAEMGIAELHATCDDRIEAAARWLTRLGFEHDAALSAETGETVWTCRVSKQPS